MKTFGEEKLSENEGLPAEYSITPDLAPWVILFSVLLFPGLILIIYLPHYFGNLGLVIGIVFTFISGLSGTMLLYKWFRKHEKN